ncbi:MAG TPA: hypothetical protein VLL95_02430 [Phnomibacter sp.]|nr:hypothetical protein [Phnomibacter sp.]
MKTSWILIPAVCLHLAACKKETIYTPLNNPVDYTQQMAPVSTRYSLEQAMSDNGQLMTIAFSGLAFITGSDGADAFFPPGKVADFFGFQYMRDIDDAGYGHNTQFLTRAANNVLKILNSTQKAKLVSLAKEQASLYTQFAYNRFPLMNAFRRNLNGDIPAGSTGFSMERAKAYTAKLYKLDADLSYNRAVMMGELVQSLTADQKTYLAAMLFNNFNTWPDVPEDADLKRGMTNNEFVAVMTYASEFFSWYKGGLNADIYFCPERHGTYFGGFFLKDYPAMNNPNYFIPLDQTGECGKAFLEALNTTQRSLIATIIPEQKATLAEIATVRESICKEMRKAMNGQAIDKAAIFQWINRYGELDGYMSALYATRFAEVKKTLTAAQMQTLKTIRNLDVVPIGAFRFATSVAMPALPNTDFFFGVGEMPANAGSFTPPADFSK